MSAVARARLQLPVRETSVGPLTHARLRRTALVYLSLAVLGLSIAARSADPGWQAFGLGLVFPGGGFLHFLAGGFLTAGVHLLFAVLTLVFFLISLALWFGTGNQAAPIVVWLGAALIAGAMGHPHTLAGSSWLVGALPVAGFLAGRRFHRTRLVAARARRDARNAEVADWPAVETPRAGALPAVEELAPEDLAALRYALDRALQPVESFDGFDIIEQFQPSALRYQINNLGYVLSLANFARLPALHGYLHEAQRNLVEKKMLARVWQYWAIENLWGNFSADTDPIGRDNVMYSGWYAAQLGLYERATGDHRYDAPGAISLRDRRGRTHVHSYPSIVERLAANGRSSAFCLFPCEPNWIYPLCNNQAVIGMKVFDHLHGTHFWRDVETLYRQRLEEEFVDVDGHMILIRSTRTGFTIPGLSSSKEDAIFAFWMHAVFPDLARRMWAIARHELFEYRDGRLELLPIKPWLDPGNYRLNTAYALGALAMAACELGDAEALSATRARIALLETRRHGGVLSYPGCSTWTHSFLLKSRLGRANALKDLVDEGLPAPWREGPVIAQAAYPEVLFAKAVSDGTALEAVLYPGSAPGRFEIRLAQLRPGAVYRLDGAQETEAAADAAGTLRLHVDLAGRHTLTVAPRD